MRYYKENLKKEHFTIKDNKIEIKDNVLFQYSQRKSKTIEVEGKNYCREWIEDVKETYKEFQKNTYIFRFSEIEVNFELLNQKYYIPEPPYFLKDYFEGYSTNNYASLLEFYSGLNFFKNINSIRVSKHREETLYTNEDRNFKWKYLWGYYDVEKGKFNKEREFIEYKKPKIIFKSSHKKDQDFSIFHYDIGWANKIYYDINLYFILTLDYEKILEHAKYLIRFFEYYDIDLKENYDIKLKKLLRVKEMIIEESLLKAQEEAAILDSKNNINYSSVQDIKTPVKVCYIMKNKRNKLYKIGASEKPKHRERTLQSEDPEVEYIKIFKKNIEKKLHNVYKEHRVRGEWFRLNKIQIKHICKHYDI